MKVLKFGGSSLAAAETLARVVEIVVAEHAAGGVVVVVSAQGGVTDALVEAARLAEQGSEAFRERHAQIATRHRTALAALAGAAEHPAVEAAIEADLGELHNLLHGVFLIREASPRTLDSVMSYGERLSAPLVAAALRHAGVDAEACDARRLIITGPEFGAGRVDMRATEARIREYFAVPRPLQVVTGFIGTTVDGETTTLGRGGSDYTASLLGAALGLDVELWTDVDGVLTADPRLVPQAESIPRLSYEELMELSHFGAKVVHAPSVHPVRARGLPLRIKNTFSPSAPGTLITTADAPSERPVRGVASISRVALLRLEGDGLVGTPGIAMRLFGALAREKVNVILISQASSEHSICFAVSSDEVRRASRSVEEEFALELRAGLVDPLVTEPDMAIVAAVGAGMRHRAGVAGRLFGVLGEQRINVRAIAQGSSELNISFVVAGSDAADAVRAVHDALVLPPRRRVEITVAGVGTVGRALLKQLGARQASLNARPDIELILTAVVDSRSALIAPQGLDPGAAVERLRIGGEPYDMQALVRSLAAPSRARRLLVDCTASPAVAACYEELLAAGIHVVTPNKLRPAGPGAAWRRLQQAGPGHLYYEATVGAGLPVVGPLTALVATGDRIRSIEGVLSGTLGFLTSELAAGRPFSEAVLRARQAGLTEPDPREDLSGADAARKLLILARLAGRELEIEDVHVEPMLPRQWYDLPLEEFWRRLPELDEGMAARQREAAANGGRLCYLARLGEHEAHVALTTIPPGHPCAGLSGPDNLVAVMSDRYHTTPWVVRGPGAGPEVTAAGVFADVLRAAAEI